MKISQDASEYSEFNSFAAASSKLISLQWLRQVSQWHLGCRFDYGVNASDKERESGNHSIDFGISYHYQNHSVIGMRHIP
jgi:hypothetical protein